MKWLVCQRHHGAEESGRLCCRSGDVHDFFCGFPRTIRVGPMKRLSCSQLTEKCDSQSVLMCIPKALMKEWFDYGILKLIYCMEVDPALAFVAMARLF